ncbi:MAG: hypothetical protein NZ959_02920 [Armatimonadetes bacterium]|nr:hypothetical protein [Armatimonadota bacterium]MDW8121597.1 hypothetical protein [Armatimonadota bacterium]
MAGEEDERELINLRLDPQDLIDPDEFAVLVNLLHTRPDGHQRGWWRQPPQPEFLNALNEALEWVRKLADFLQQAEQWELALIRSDQEDLFVEHLFKAAEQLSGLVKSNASILIEYHRLCPLRALWKNTSEWLRN